MPPKDKEPTMEDLAKQVKDLTAKVDALESGGKQKKKKSDTPRAPSKYNIFFKKCIEELKKECPDMTHQERFKECAKRWKDQKD